MKPTLKIIVSTAAFLAIALLADSWRSARHDAQQVAATLATQNVALQQAVNRENQRDKQMAAALATIQAQKRAVHSPQQAAAQLASVLPPLPLPVSVQGPVLSVPFPAGEIPPTILSIPQPDLIPLYDQLQDCRASTQRNDTLQEDLADEKMRAAEILHERDAALSAAHGGAFFARLKRAAKWFILGAAVGAAAASAARR